MLPAVVVAVGALFAAGAAAPGPSSGRCAGAWNHTAPAAVLARAAEQRVRQATVQVVSTRHHTVTSTKAGTETTTRDCVVVLFLPAGRTLTLFGAWADGTVADWSRPAARPGPTTGGGNACVAGDGTIHRVGRFTADARCP
jgi:hypothetical protein